MPFLCTHFSNPTPIRLLPLPSLLYTFLLKVSHDLCNGNPMVSFQPLPYFSHHQYFTQPVISFFWKHLLHLAFRAGSPLISLATLCFSPPQCLLFIFTLFIHFLDNLIKSHGFKHKLLLISNSMSLSWKSEFQMHQSNFLYNFVTWRASDISICPICSSPSRTSSK